MMRRLTDFCRDFLKSVHHGGDYETAASPVSFSSIRPRAALSPMRSKIVLGLLFAAFIALGIRALWLQVLSTDFLQKQGENRYARRLEMPAIRGRILDRNGKVLASSMQVKAIWAIPEDASSAPKEKLRRLAELLEMPEDTLMAKLNSEKSFVYLKRQVDLETADKIKALEIPGIQQKKEYKRYYPEGEVMAHVVGFTNIEDKGQEGIELASQDLLAGENGSRRVVKDRLGNIVDDLQETKDPVDGQDLVLSIDSQLQYIAYKCLKEAIAEHQAKAGSVVVLDTRTGEVLAMVNMPVFNPNNRKGLTGAQLRNRVMTDAFEPGSIMKPFAVAMGLDRGKVTPNTMISTNGGKMTIGTATIGDSHAHGTLSVDQIIEKSSNIGTAKIALMFPPQEMWEMLSSVGFGQQPQFGFPGATPGRLRPYKSWVPVEQATMSYGHGVSVSLFQIARAYMIFARNGDMIPLTFMKREEMPEGQQIISPKTAEQMRHMLELVVGPGGTAKLAHVPGYRVGGKTGTAYKIEHGRYVKKYVGSFVGLAPISDPKVIIAVMIDEPIAGHFGGTVAAPVFSKLAAEIMRAMNIPPDA